MRLGEPRRAASQNLIQTYFALGNAIFGSSAGKDAGYRFCIGTLPHPICNFAVDLNLDLWSTYRLRELAKAHDPFYVYHLPGDDLRTESLLVRSGFRPCLKLEQMSARGAHNSTELVEAIAPEERLAVAQFMGEQFFSDQSPAFRRVVTQATAVSDLELHAIYEGTSLAAAMILCVTDHHFGVYNLCVHSSRRNRGLGGELVRAALARAAESEKDVTLQCDERLAAWYARLGFSTSGIVNVYSLPKR